MSTPTTTIRVSVATRDRLAAQARAKGVSVSSLLADMAAQAERSAVFAAERAAELAESQDPKVRQEIADWDRTTGDGID